MAANGEPILPPVQKSPNLTLTIERKAEQKIRKAMRAIQKQVVELFDTIPRKRAAADQAGITGNAQTYIYQIQAEAVAQLTGELGAIIEQNLLEAGAVNWFMYEAVRSAEETGVGAEVRNLQAQFSDTEYPITTQSAMLTDAHRARVTLAEGRVFEEMQNLTSSMKTSLGRVLGDGMASGMNPRDIAKRIYNEIGMPEWNDKPDGSASYARALRIARTEVNTAHRRAKRGERDQARKIGLTLGVMHMATMRANTRPDHAARHGWIGTEQEEVEWYAAKSGRAIHCRCTTTAVALDSDGNPKSKTFVGRVKAQKLRWEDKSE